nr:clavaminate synthase isozyme 3, CS3 {N-terminal} [Streptomyces antibioticus, Tu 1718, Peptide Partial, 21 aa] [Streptomyces antibioticus]
VTVVDCSEYSADLLALASRLP